MTKEEIDALVLFKDYTHLQLKGFKIFLFEERQKNKSTSGGGGDQYEDRVLNRALELHHIYTSRKLKGTEILSGKYKQGNLGL